MKKQKRNSVLARQKRAERYEHLAKRRQIVSFMIEQAHQRKTKLMYSTALAPLRQGLLAALSIGVPLGCQVQSPMQIEAGEMAGAEVLAGAGWPEC